MPEVADTIHNPIPRAEGLIDVHCHLLPGLDDGCRDLRETLTCIEQLRQTGYTGSICTPHMAPDQYPANTIVHIRARVMLLRQQLAKAGVDYQVWPGGELCVKPNLLDWLTPELVPTLADSRCVLMDTWEPDWPQLLPKVADWMHAHGFQPVLAHPERLPGLMRHVDTHLKDLERLGVWLQGNLPSFVGMQGREADHLVRRLLQEGRYRFLALDVHRPDSLADRIDGLNLARQEFGAATVDPLLSVHPRRDLFSPAV